MESLSVHHVEFRVKNGEIFMRKIMQQYMFSLIATRFDICVKQWVLKSGSAYVLITQHKTFDSSSDRYCAAACNHKPDMFCTYPKPSHVVDTVFNVALKVKNVDYCIEKLSRSGVAILKTVTNQSDIFGNVKIATVKSCIGNVVHSLIEDTCYKGIFLPNFTPADTLHLNPKSQVVTHFDHITFACECGDSDRILKWYASNFGMRRFLINRDEDEDHGFEIDTEDIGLRLKAFEYWKCAETGLSLGPQYGNIKFVVAEALPNHGPNQVDTFLHEHGGAGIQHIGLHTDDMVNTISTLKGNGVDFAEPPYTYYTEVGKLEEICRIGQNVQTLLDHGILVDAEADLGNLEPDFSEETSHLRYLMQKFTKPVFNRNTFFWEIIQRVGARGFGSGNITALWRSVQAYINNKSEESDKVENCKMNKKL